MVVVAHAEAWYLEPSVSAQVANFVRVDTGNAAATHLLSPDVLGDPIVHPPRDVLARLVFTKDLGAQEKLYSDAWARVQAAPSS